MPDKIDYSSKWQMNYQTNMHMRGKRTSGEFAHYHKAALYLYQMGYEKTFISIRPNNTRIEVDVVGVKQFKHVLPRIIAVEAKGGWAVDFDKVKEQALIRLKYAERVFIMLILPFTSNFTWLCHLLMTELKGIRDCGLGLMIYDEARDDLEVMIMPRWSKQVVNQCKINLLEACDPSLIPNRLSSKDWY